MTFMWLCGWSELQCKHLSLTPVTQCKFCIFLHGSIISIINPLLPAFIDKRVPQFRMYDYSIKMLNIKQ